MPKTKTDSRPNKSDFIRRQPVTLSAAEVVEKGKAEGVKFDAFLVYKVRSRLKANARPASKAPSSATSVAKPGAAPTTSPEDLLKALAAELGLRRAVEILEAERARVRSAIRA